MVEQEPESEKQESELINVAAPELKKKKRFIKPEKNLLKNFMLWVAIGVLVGLVFTFLGLKVNRSFLVFIPVGPASAIIGWFVKKLSKKFEDKDLLSS